MRTFRLMPAGAATEATQPSPPNQGVTLQTFSFPAGPVDVL